MQSAALISLSYKYYLRFCFKGSKRKDSNVEAKAQHSMCFFCFKSKDTYFDAASLKSCVHLPLIPILPFSTFIPNFT